MLSNRVLFAIGVISLFGLFYMHVWQPSMASLDVAKDAIGEYKRDLNPPEVFKGK